MVPGADVREWTFNGYDYLYRFGLRPKVDNFSPSLKRTATGRFRDGDLANILHNATERPAGAFRARGTPLVLRVIEILSIEQARSWGTCSVGLTVCCQSVILIQVIP